VLIAGCTQYPADSDAYRSASMAIQALNDLAEAIGSDRDFFQKPPDGSHMSARSVVGLS
jgi:hypothetical protein